ncbi:MAG: hypothetical protein RLZZ455_867 [Candidatus Parcubacteria bacterium]|jgi:beta-lactamase class A
MKILIALLLLLSLALNGWLLWGSEKSPEKKKSDVSELEKKYPHLSKRILVETQNDLVIRFLPLRKELRSVVAPYGESFGFYFEYLPTGASIGVNEKNEFESASLFKVPIVMAYYRTKEKRGIVEDPIVTIQKSQIDKEFGSLWKRGVGAKISLKDAVSFALRESDNTAAQIISSYKEHDDLLDVYEGIDIDLKTVNQHAIISVKGFSSVLKSLFFASVISRDHSEFILSELSQSVFSNALRSGVPEEIPVAHKVGFLDENMYMDCGIVYVPRRPYVLCMVSASDGDEADRRMKEVSEKIYNFVKDVSPTSSRMN